MKYSFMSFSMPDLSLQALLAVAKDYGYEGVELRIEAGHAHGVETRTTKAQRDSFRRMFGAAGIEPACIATSATLGDPSTAEYMVGSAIASIELASDLGAPVIRVFGGSLAPGCSREQAICTVSRSLLRLAEHAASRNVSVCIETHDDWAEPHCVADVLGRVNHPAVGVVWDVLHLVRTGKASIEDSFATLKSWIRHTHIHDSSVETIATTSIGQGDIDHRLVAKLLDDIGYEGFLSGEWMAWEPHEIPLARGVRALEFRPLA